MTKLILLLFVSTLYFYSREINALNIGKASKIDIIVSMKEGVEKVHEKLRLKTYSNRESRLNSVYDELTKHRDISQTPLLNFLNSKHISHDSLWISNQIYIPNVDAELLDQIQNFPGVSKVAPNEYFQIDSHPSNKNVNEEEPGWNIRLIQADLAWMNGWNGTGAKVGLIDTGARYTHEALSESYVGTNNYGWRDLYTNSPNPIDNNGAGTHSTGIVSGSLGIGVAPGSKWMMCTGCNSQGNCGQAQLMGCAQFFTCPTDPNGNNPICSRAPYIVSNSWGGGTTGNWFDAAMQGWLTAGILGVFGIGNSGPSCSSANYPGNSPFVLAVGAATNFGSVASFSSKGPVVGTTRIKPDIVAPGTNIRSSSNTADDAYITLNSGAVHHVSGTLALMFGKNPRLSVSAAINILLNTADRDLPATGMNCGGVSENLYPNNAAGWGRVNAYRACLAA